MSLKTEVSREILALLDNSIDNEIVASNGQLTVAEIAREVILQAPKEVK